MEGGEERWRERKEEGKKGDEREWVGKREIFLIYSPGESAFLNVPQRAGIC